MTALTTREVIDGYYAALRTGDRARLLELLAPDAVWIAPASSPVPRVEGAEAVVKALGGDVIRENFDLSKPFRVEVRRTLVDGDFAVVQQRLTGQPKATTEPYDNQYCWVYEVRDGRLAVLEEYA